MYQQPAFRWQKSDWRESAESWIREHAAAAGLEVTGAVTGVRFLPWSAVLRAPTNLGDIYFKACGPSQRHEPALAAYLAKTRPDCMIPVLAADTTHGWYLMPDGGPTLADVIQLPPGGIGHWASVLSLQAGVQRQLIPAAEQLLRVGVPDRRPEILADLLETMLAQPETLLTGRPNAMNHPEIVELQHTLPRLSELCRKLATIGPPDTFVHDDFHEDHIFTWRDNDGAWHYQFFDFGDACISHPFVQLVSQPRFVGHRFGTEMDPAKDRLREVYLAKWHDFAPYHDLDRALSLALIAGCVARALTWVNACGEHLDELPPGLLLAYETGVAFWLRQMGERIERLDAT